MRNAMKTSVKSLKQELTSDAGLFVFALLFLAMSLYGVFIFQKNFPIARIEPRIPPSLSAAVDGE